jgi:hypothetical protein
MYNTITAKVWEFKHNFSEYVDQQTTKAISSGVMNSILKDQS